MKIKAKKLSGLQSDVEFTVQLFLNDIENIRTLYLKMVPTERVTLTWPLWTNDLQSFLALYETK